MKDLTIPLIIIAIGLLIALNVPEMSEPRVSLMEVKR